MHLDKTWKSKMYEFSIDVKGDEGGNGKKETDDVSKKFTARKKNKNAKRKRLDLKKMLPELPISNKTEAKNTDTLDFNDTYLISAYKTDQFKQSGSSNVDKIMSKSSLQPGLEKKHAIPIISDRMAKLMRKKEREKTKGEDWYNLPAPHITEEIKNDLQILRMRSVLDKNHFYKKNNVKHISKYFQVGTVVENAADFYSGRIIKSKRKKTLVEELLADAEFKAYQKKKYKEIMDNNRRKQKRPMQGLKGVNKTKKNK